MEKIPIFVITFNRLETLKRTLQSYYDTIKSPWELVINDHGSTYPQTVEYLKGLESKGIKVYWKGEMVREPNYQTMPKVAETIADYFTHNPPSKFVVTDDDYALESDGDILEAFSYLLDSHPEAEVIGPEMILWDIPDGYADKQRCINHYEHTRIIYKQNNPDLLGRYNNKYIYGHSQWVESNFGMYRPGTNWTCVRKMGYRTFEPYMIRHLAWYITSENITPDYQYYLDTRMAGKGGCSQW